jgi:hypothetical protein
MGPFWGIVRGDPATRAGGIGFAFARQKAKRADVIRRSFFVVTREY